MNKIKSFFQEKLNSVIFMWIGVFIAIVAVLLMFAPGLVVSARTYSSAVLFWNRPGAAFPNGAWPVFVGYMLILVGALIMGIIALPIVTIQVKAEKICLISAISAIAIGAILIMCIRPILVGCNPNSAALANLIDCKPAPYIAGVFALLAAGCGGAALAYDWE